MAKKCLHHSNHKWILISIFATNQKYVCSQAGENLVIVIGTRRCLENYANIYRLQLEILYYFHTIVLIKSKLE